MAGNGAGGARHGKGFLDLAKDLRLADDHGIQAGGDAEEMAHGRALAMLIDMRVECGGVDAKAAGEKAGELHLGPIDHGDELDAVAGRDDHALGYARHGGQRARGFGQLVTADSDALAQRDGCGPMIDADEYERHCGPNLCTLLMRLAAQTAIMTARAAPET